MYYGTGINGEEFNSRHPGAMFVYYTDVTLTVRITITHNATRDRNDVDLR